MSTRNSVVMALASSVWKLVSAWWKVDRIRIPDSRTADNGRQNFEDQLGVVETARERRRLLNSQKSEA